MSFLSGFSESRGSVSSSVRAESRISEGSPDLSEEVSDSGHAEFYEQPNMTGMLLSELTESNLPHCCGYRWSSMVNTYATAVPMFTSGKTSTELFAERCTSIDNVCHGREDHDHDFFYIYRCLFTDSHVRLPFDEFTMGVLRILNVAPTQLHPNSWASLQAFRFSPRCSVFIPPPMCSCLIIVLVPLAPSNGFLWLANLTTFWLLLSLPLTSISKIFFFKIVITPAGRQHFLNKDASKFPLYWIRDPIFYLSWLRSAMTEDDKMMFEILDQLPRKLNVCSILKLYLSSHCWVDLYDMFVFYTIMV